MKQILNKIYKLYDKHIDIGDIWAPFVIVGIACAITCIFFISDDYRIIFDTWVYVTLWIAIILIVEFVYLIVSQDSQKKLDIIDVVAYKLLSVIISVVFVHAMFFVIYGAYKLLPMINYVAVGKYFVACIVIIAVIYGYLKLNQYLGNKVIKK